MYKVAVMGLGMGSSWAKAAVELPNAELTMVYDKYFDESPRVDKAYFSGLKVKVAATEDEVYNSDADIVVVASPDGCHADQCIKAMESGKHVCCEKPLALTMTDCEKIIAAVRRTQRRFMTGQVCRYAPGFKTAKALVDAGKIGELVCLESEYAHDYEHAKGYRDWRIDPKVLRHGFLGGGCHALDLVRWIAGDPEEVFCYMNHKFYPEWPTADAGEAVAKFPNEVIARIFVSTGVKRPYTMRTVIYGTRGSIVCDNTSNAIQICEKPLCDITGELAFTSIPVAISNHNVTSELEEFLRYLEQGKNCPTDVYEGTKTVAFANAAIRSSECGAPVKIDYSFLK